MIEINNEIWETYRGQLVKINRVFNTIDIHGSLKNENEWIPATLLDYDTGKGEFKFEIEGNIEFCNPYMIFLTK
ncbi:hypothetical protein EHQ90_10505 [Leptospira stimsonii]|uniref:DUF5348 domain-containing protein n=1 Tax=Leptospira stimsonii TaxID=2202203 RepID=A0ABY2N3M6_9LEPT|nr:hypothetical protein [Leptospira stimsonii]TGM14903.1 hypothetical protein EHQ90_10505 [Leptospira stimsonii]